jgi:hypothetical protein
MQAPTKANLPRLDSFMMHSFAYENLDKQVTNFQKLPDSTRAAKVSQKKMNQKFKSCCLFD